MWGFPGTSGHLNKVLSQNGGAENKHSTTNCSFVERNKFFFPLFILVKVLHYWQPGKYLHFGHEPVKQDFAVI